MDRSKPRVSATCLRAAGSSNQKDYSRSQRQKTFKQRGPLLVLEIRVLCERATSHCHRERRLSGFLLRPLAIRGRRQQAGQLNINEMSIRMELTKSLTDKTSFTENQPPPPFLPLRATMAPGNTLTLACPFGPPRILKFGANLSGTRTPDPIIRDDSMQRLVSLSFPEPEEASASTVIRPTTTTSSYESLATLRNSETRLTSLDAEGSPGSLKP
jgi:hypothetical protein